MLRTLLTAPGVEVQECGDGADALKAYGRFQPDWVFMDSYMADLDGLAATRHLLGLFSEARVVLVSEDGSSQLRRAACAAGACGFVTKDDLLEGLRQNRGAAVSKLEPLWMASKQKDT